MYVVYYQWQIKPGKETQFIEAWTRLTEALQQKTPKVAGKLLKTLQEEYIALIEWPSQKDWESQTTENIDLSIQTQLMDCVENMVSVIPLQCLKEVKPTS